MSRVSEKIVTSAIKDPGKVYSSAEAVLHDPRLSDEEKRKILESWKQDQIALLRAEDESMTRSTGTQPVEKLESIQKAEGELATGD